VLSRITYHVGHWSVLPVLEYLRMAFRASLRANVMCRSRGGLLR
jgi:hypothetical protein